MSVKSIEMNYQTMNKTLILSFLSLGIIVLFISILLFPGNAGANFSQAAQPCFTAGCHDNNVGSPVIGVDGSATTSINKNSTSSVVTFELEYYYTGLNGKDRNGVYIQLPAGWTISNGTNVIAGFDGNWNSNYDQTAGAAPGWAVVGGSYPDDYRVDFTTSNFTSHGTGTACDDGSSAIGGSDKCSDPDNDGGGGLMGIDAVIGIPSCTATGAYVITLSGVGHVGNTRSYKQGTLTVNVTNTCAPNTNPNAPTNLAQYESDGTTVIPSGGYYTVDTTVVIEADISDPDGGDTVRLQADIDSDGNSDCQSVLVANPSTNVQVSCTVADGNSYDWQVRTQDNSGANSAWVSYAGTPDFIVDLTAPSVSSTVPTNGATGVALDSNVTINWDENVDCTTVNTTNITSDSPGWTLSSCSGSQAIFTTSGQANNTTYNVNVTTNVTDVAGNPMAANYPFSYTTVAGGNNPPNDPSNPAQYESDGTTVIPSGGYYTVDTTVVIEADISDPDGGDTIRLQVDIDSDGNSDCQSALVANPSTNVQVSCTVADGNSYDWQVRTQDNSGATSAWVSYAGTPDFIVDLTAPSVSSTVPINGATGVALDSNVTINWDENVDCTTVNMTNITSDSPGWALSSCSGSQAVFTTSGQANNATYNVNVTTNVTDVAGNPMAANYPFSYTTSGVLICDTAPTVQITPNSQIITTDGGSQTYLVEVTNNDSGGCADTSFSFAMTDSNAGGPGDFNNSTVDIDPLVIAEGASGYVTLTVSAKTGVDGVSNDTFIIVSAAGHGDGTSNTVTTYVDLSAALGSGDGNVLRRSTDEICHSCHKTEKNAPADPDAIKMHNSVNTGSSYWGGDWGTPTGQYGEFTCTTCHTSHQTRNIVMIKETITTPDGSNWATTGTPDVSVDFRYMNAAPGNLYTMGDDSDAPRSSSGRICEACHSQTSKHAYNQAADTGHNNSADCSGCHTHNEAFVGGGCDSCHGGSGNAYPPVAFWGTNKTTANGVGAHVTHLENTGTIFTKEAPGWCDECHHVPASVDEAGHQDAAYPADIDFTSAVEAKYGSQTPSFTAEADGDPDTGVGGRCSNVYCHGSTLAEGTNTTPDWGDTISGCTACHGNPATAASVPDHETAAAPCTDCHSHSGSGADHIDGSITFPNATCTSCHSQPPDGSTYPNQNKSHSTHFSQTVEGGTPVTDCNSPACHAKPATMDHADGTVQNTCSTATCHNSSILSDSGSTPSPTWGTGTADCGWCHENPPSTTASVAADHTGVMATTGCSNCHSHEGTTSPADHIDAAITYPNATCTSCHAQPPNGASAPNTNGSHTAHFNQTVEGGAPISDCNSPACHVKPGSTAFDHADGTTQQTCSTATCHNTGVTTDPGSTPNPTWGTGTADCGWCHENPPSTTASVAADHTGVPATTGCSNCHAHEGTGSPATHIDGSVSFPNATCTSCHSQPPDGVSAPNTNGSHTAHFNQTVEGGAPISDCDSPACHVKPATMDHANGITAQSCDSTACHNTGVTTDPGSTPNPTWGSGSANCGWCHENPPSSTASVAADHTGVPATTGCSNCHSHEGTSSPADHINGAITYPNATCTSCHGQPPDGVSAPNTNGSHQSHFNQTIARSDLVTDCNSPACHVKPVSVDHADGSTVQSCDTTLCHNTGLPDATNTNPTWGDNTADCTWCHGNPPTSSAKFAHGGVTPGSCTGCHPHEGTGSPAEHIDGTLQASGGSCTGCHDGVPGGATYVTRDVMGTTDGSGDFTQASRHVFGGTPDNWDCIVCHREGNETEAASGNVATNTLHNNAGGIVVDMRNVDTPGSGWTWDKNSPNYTNMDNFCMSCHDANGASGIAVNAAGDGVTLSPGGLASTPFNDALRTSNTKGGSAIFDSNGDGIPDGYERTAVLNVYSQFDPNNPSHHAVRGQAYSSHNSNWGDTAWVDRTLKSGSQLITDNLYESAQLHCADCHTVDAGVGGAHGGSNGFMLQASTIDNTCYLCHNSATYSNNSSSDTRWSHDNESAVWDVGAGAVIGDYDSTDGTDAGSICRNCHGGDPVTDGFGGIHGLPAGSDPRSGEQRYRFIGGSYMSYQPSSWTGTTGGTPTCYFDPSAKTVDWSYCTHHNGTDTGGRTGSQQFSRGVPGDY
jgi:predicted CxxxxCH...CXXCH cytochrome family protein